MQAEALYDPVTTGLLLYFAATWIWAAGAISGPIGFTDGIRHTVYVMAMLAFYFGAFYILMFGWIFSMAYSLWWNTRPENVPGSKSPVWFIVEGYIVPVEVLVGFLRWIPLEVGVVAFTFAILHMITLGSDYATN